jgi:cytochrome c553
MDREEVRRMKIMKVFLLLLIILGLTFSVAFAKKHLPEERGKTLFEDSKFAGGSKACSECHPNGKGLEKAVGKKEFKIMGKTQKSLEDAVNFCIVNANKGKAIDVKSDQMKDMAAYIKSLKGKKSPGY